MPAFQFSNTKRWRKLGLEGDLCWAMIHEGGLHLQDDAKHVVRIMPAETARVRIGFYDARRRIYHLRVWRDRAENSLEMIPTTATWPGYRETVHAFVQLMKDANRADRVETGTSKFDALLGPILIGIPTLGAIVLALFVLTEEPWWGRMLVPFVPTLLFVILIWVAVKRYWPRTLKDVSDLKPQLPPG